MLPSESDKISIRYYKKRGEELWHNTSMLIEDLHQGIIPLSGAKFEEIVCSLNPDKTEFSKNLCELLPTYRSHSYSSFKEIVIETIEYFANALLNQGYIALELVTYEDINGKVYYKLEPFFGEKIKIQRKKIIQIISEEQAKELNISKSIIIPSDKCFIIDFPKSLGGRIEYLKFIEDFRVFDNQAPMLNFANNPLIGQKNYEINEHQKLHDLELWKKSRKFNWNHRGHNKLFSGYYSTYRNLNFAKSKIILRDYIIEHLKSITLSVSERVAEKTDSKLKV
jgi:hypothetical protein